MSMNRNKDFWYYVIMTIMTVPGIIIAGVISLVLVGMLFLFAMLI